MSPLYTVLKIDKGNATFFEYYFGSSLWHKYMHKIANYGARHDRMSILQDDFMNMPIPYPSMNEQNKIAEFLLALDNYVNTIKLNLLKAQNWEKCLLQQMFV